MLLLDVEVHGSRCDVRIHGHRIRAVGSLSPAADEEVIDGHGGALIPGLADQHIHLRALAAARESVDVSGGLTALMDAVPVDGWIRGVGLPHDILPTRRDLDALRCDVPMRVQDRSGALWVLNSPAVIALGDLDGEPDVDQTHGWLWRRDDLLDQLPRTGADLAGVCAELLSYGITHLTDATPNLNASDCQALKAVVPQHLLLLGDSAGLGPVKIVVPDHDLPSFQWLLQSVTAARPRSIAVHCVTAAAVALVIGVLDEVGVLRGDRIEHAAVTPPDAITWLASNGVAVVTQPSLPGMRGEAYLRGSEPVDRPDLWRHASLLQAGVVVACSSDAPYGSVDPWVHLGGPGESPGGALTLDGWLRDPLDLRLVRRVAAGEPADLCLLQVPLAQALRSPSADLVRHVVLRGDLAV